MIAVPSREAAERIRRCGGTMLSSGPIQPPMLGAAVGSARVHTSSEFPAFHVAGLMQERGFLCCICVFPAVPMNRPGIRFTISRHNHREDITSFVAALAQSLALGRRQAILQPDSQPVQLMQALQ